MNAAAVRLRPGLLPGVIFLLMVLVGVAGWLGGPSIVLIFLAAVALCTSIALMWSSLERMGEKASLDFEDALGVAVPSATEEQKLAVLRALKDLEYELTVGKISRQDFDLASSDYRDQARRLIAAQDESMHDQLAKAEERVLAFLQTAAAPTSPAQSETAQPGPGSRTAPSSSSPAPAPDSASTDAAD